MNRNAWQLFSNDLDLAKQTLEIAQAQSHSPEDVASLCQHLTFFGAFEQAQRLLLSSEPEVLKHVNARAALMRIRQYRLHPNPLISLCRAEQKSWFKHICQRVAGTDQPIQVDLGCGLGDMLETLAALHTNTTGLKQRTQLIVPAWAQAALVPLLSQDQNAHQLSWTDQNDPTVQRRSEDSCRLPMMVFKAAWAQTPQGTDPQPVRSATTNVLKRPTLLCCWRPKVDPLEKLWAHLRSLDWGSIVGLYRQLVPLAQRKGFDIVDITHYRDHEAQELLNRHPSGLHLAASQLQSFVDTTHWLGSNSLVASVDTSLVHLACWCGRRPILLAHRWPDGRWLKGSWQSIDILEQEKLYDWEPPIERLIQRIETHAWT